MIDGEEVF